MWNSLERAPQGLNDEHVHRTPVLTPREMSRLVETLHKYSGAYLGPADFWLRYPSNSKGKEKPSQQMMLEQRGGPMGINEPDPDIKPHSLKWTQIFIGSASSATGKCKLNQ